jgi:DNA-binding transcriptional ArsR family regulator
MSIKYISAVLEAKIGNSSRKLVLLKLADSCNDGGMCWPKYETIASDCELDRRSVMRHVKALESMGIVSISNRFTEHGNTSNLYQLSLARLIELKGDSHVTRGVTPVSLGGCHPCHPEPSLEPSVEPKEKDYAVSQAKAAHVSLPDNLRSTWNELAERLGLPSIRVISEEKAKLVKDAYRFYAKLKKLEGESEVISIEEFIPAYLDRVKDLANPFHLGENDRGWKMDFGYVFSKKVVEHVINDGILKR